jgi:quercetin dioxygenase-like cupin family protein
MEVVNFLRRPAQREAVHGGDSQCLNCRVLGPESFDTPVRFLYYTILPSGASFGEHAHGDDNEVYIILEGVGIYGMNGETVSVEAGDILINKPFASHFLKNTGSGEMRVLVFEVYNR